MKADDLHRLDVLDARPTDGAIHARDRRVVLCDADALGQLREELVATLGYAGARAALLRTSFANGYRDALTARRRLAADSDRAWWLACPALLRTQGKVHAEPRTLIVDRDGGRFEVELEWRDSFEAQQHRRVFGEAREPVCWTITGYASGFSSACFGEQVFVVEHECAASGAGTTCRAVGKPRREWGQRADALAADYAASRLARDLERTEQRLQRVSREASRSARQLARLRGEIDGAPTGLVAHGRAMERVLELADTAAGVDAPLLVTGERGVGKERLARRVHDRSARAAGPFVPIACGALPEPLLESELFGHVRGAFAGADRPRRGQLEAARGGTVFLDEIDAASPALQVKLLRALRDREARPVGSSRARPLDVRVIAATQRDLAAQVAAGRFREDLYYRLKVIALALPALRDRPEDVLPLARDFAAAAARAYGHAPCPLTPEAAEALVRYAWPGNVRELENVIYGAVVLAGDRGRLERAHLPPEVRGDAAPLELLPNEIVPLAELEKRYVLAVLARLEGNRTKTARALRIGANTLWRKLKTWGIPSAR